MSACGGQLASIGHILAIRAKYNLLVEGYGLAMLAKLFYRTLSKDMLLHTTCRMRMY